jgi:hypothetical protein
VRLIQIGLGIRDLRDRASVLKKMPCPVYGGSELLNALPFIHSIPSKSPAPARWLDVPSQSPGLGVT